MMLEYLGVKESPSHLSEDKNSWFFAVVSLFACPIFGRDREREGFTSLVREFVDNWNLNIARAQETGQL